MPALAFLSLLLAFSVKLHTCSVFALPSLRAFLMPAPPFLPALLLPLTLRFACGLAVLPLPGLLLPMNVTSCLRLSSKLGLALALRRALAPFGPTGHGTAKRRRLRGPGFCHQRSHRDRLGTQGSSADGLASAFQAALLARTSA